MRPIGHIAYLSNDEINLRGSRNLKIFPKEGGGSEGYLSVRGWVGGGGGPRHISSKFTM